MSTKKSQFGKRLCQNEFFSHPHPPYRRIPAGPTVLSPVPYHIATKIRNPPPLSLPSTASSLGASRRTVAASIPRIELCRGRIKFPLSHQALQSPNQALLAAVVDSCCGDEVVMPRR
jgi:hypothetical protein